ncbi:hypothetical protein JZ751_009881 [Albula glossodonta]|uniref:Membrane-spanning 4-domains subfamily A member 4A n=1 Tax=Albula glossodonta TaxID=121402 RepID=A0A8T2NYB6_9TELE|nr:hypothetical protein JZ751_009881 [Albula glossodonta]
MSGSASASNGFVVVTQVYPQQRDTAAPPLYTAPNVSSVLGKFLKGEPKALGYMISGALTVAADNKLNKCLVKGALGMNIVSTLTAVTAIILHCLDFVYDFGESCYYYPGSSYACWEFESMYKSRSHGITGVLLVFSILEFIVSIYVSAFACKAVCHSTPEQVVFIQNPAAVVNTVTTESLPMPKMYETIQIPYTTSNQKVLNDFNRN